MDYKFTQIICHLRNKEIEIVALSEVTCHICTGVEWKDLKFFILHSNFILSYFSNGKFMFIVASFGIHVSRKKIWSCRDHFVYAPSQWEMTLQCNVVSQWLGAYIKWSLKVGVLYCIYLGIFYWAKLPTNFDKLSNFYHRIFNIDKIIYFDLFYEVILVHCWALLVTWYVKSPSCWPLALTWAQLGENLHCILRELI